MRVLLTGSGGFIGSNLLSFLQLKLDNGRLFSLDRLSRDQLVALAPDTTHYSVDLVSPALQDVIADVAPDMVIHLAAETHVDRSIAAAGPFLESNVSGTWNLLEALRRWLDANPERKNSFRLIHVSTDEVFGEASGQSDVFSERSPYAPRNPYAATKAAADHLVDAWATTYGMRAVILHPSNNYGPWQHPEKLIPGTILRLLEGRAVPVYGDGLQSREWLWVGDFCAAVWAVAERPHLTGRFLVGSGSRTSNLGLIQELCHILAARRGVDVSELLGLVTHVEDRPGHDRHYRLDSGKFRSCSGWQPMMAFREGLEETVDWALQHRDRLLRQMSGNDSVMTNREE